METKLEIFRLVLAMWILVYQCDAEETGEEYGSPEEYGENVDWCDLPCENGEDNVLCLENSVDNYPMECSNFSLLDSPETRSEILHWHNELRNNVAWGRRGLPMATNMRQLDWNEDLELSATFWVLTCTVGLARCSRTKKFMNVGQNMNVVGAKKRSTTAPDIMSCLRLWAAEEGRVTNNTIKNYSVIDEGQWTANYVNIIGAKTYSLGCASAGYSQGGYNFRTVVCNYGPGLEEMHSVYNEGWPCQGCPFNTSCRNGSLYPGLCATSDQPLGKSPPIETTAIARTGDLLQVGGAPLSSAWSAVLAIVGTMCAVFVNDSGLVKSTLQVK